MRKNIYQMYVKSQQGFVYYNSLNDAYVVLNPRLHDIFQNTPLEALERDNHKLYEMLKSNEFIVNDNFEEFKIAQLNRLNAKLNQNEYHITLNTTLDCNLMCWYCYESKVKGSKVNPAVLSLIKKNIKKNHSLEPFSILKISFFGGEPLMGFDTVKELLLYAKKFGDENGVKLIVDFTTNGTLLTDEMICFLSDYDTIFQITLDGHREKHNKVRIFEENKDRGNYDLIIENITKLSINLPKSRIWIRVNFDNKTLLNINEILLDINHLDRGKCSIILRKVWQIEPAMIDKSLIVNALLLIMSKYFFVDYFALPRVKPCFAERKNQVLFNYDGKIFKCSTIESFDDKNTEGILNEDGSIKWDQMKVANKILDTPSKECSQCTIYPACYGPCSMSKKTNCILEELNLTKDEYILYNFRQTVMFSEN